MKKKEEKKVEEVKKEEAPKKRGRQPMTPEEKEISRKYRLLKEFKKTLGIEDIQPVEDVGDDGNTQAVIDKIGDIIQGLKDLKKMIKKI